MNSQRFERGYLPEEYVNNLRNYRSLVKQLMKEAQATDDHVEALRSSKERFVAPVRATMMTEDWCGDSACNTPVLTQLFEAAEIDFRVFRGSEEEELKAMYESEGDDHIPVVSVWDGKGRELLRWIEAPESVRRKKNEWKASRPEFTELYEMKEEDKEAAKRFASLYREFLETMAGWYKSGDWTETTGEVAELLEEKAAGEK